MPQLSNGRHVGIDPGPLNDLLREADHFGNIHKAMAIDTIADVMRHVDVVCLVPQEEAGEMERTLRLHEGSSPILDGMACVPAGYRLSDWEKHAADWPEADRATFRDFLSGRAAPALREYLDAVKASQAHLRAADDFLTRLFVGWWDAGCHRAREEDWDATNLESPDWDDCDMLAALGHACNLLPQHREAVGHWQAAARLQAFWNICRGDLPQIDDLIEAARPVRDCASRMRRAGLLDRLEDGKRQWLHDQAVIECVQLWNASGDGVRAAMPQAYGTIEHVVSSPEANRYFDEAATGAKDAGHDS